MSTSPVLVPISLVSQFLAIEKIASRQWLQCQMECLLDQVFDQLSTKFDDYLASNAITDTAHHTTIHTDHIQHMHQQRHEHQHEPSFQAHSCPQFQANTDHLINTEFLVGQSQIPCKMMNVNVNQNAIHSEALMFGQPQLSHLLSVPCSQQNDEHGQYGLDGDDDQTRYKDIDDDPAPVDSDKMNIKEEIDDSHEELFTTDQAQYPHYSSVPTSNLEQSNQNDDEDGNNDQPPIEDEDAFRVDSDEIEVKEEIETDNEIISSSQNSQINLPVSASASNEQSNNNLTSENDEQYDLDDTRDDDDEQPNGFEYGGIEDDAQMDSDEVEVKEEIDDTNNQLATTKQPQNPHLLSVPTPNLEQSNQNEFEEEYGLDGADYQPQHEHLDDTMYNELITNEQNLPILPSVVTLTSNKQSNQDDENYYGLDGEDDQPPNEDLGNGHDDNERNDHAEELSRPRKRRRIDKKQPNIRPSRVTRQSSSREKSNFIERQQTEETVETNELKDQEKQITTLSLQCLETDCPLMFPNRTELNLHMNTQHGVLLHRCLVKDCKQSFSTQYKLSDHVKQVHSNTIEWHCDKCPKHFTTYLILSMHNYQMHQLGQYKCAFADCTFVGEHRRKTVDHYRNIHKATIVELTCHHPNCGRRFNDASNFTRHQRTHLGIKPYRCKWPECNFASTTQSNALRHIKQMHLTPDQRSNEDDPKKYLEVLRDLFQSPLFSSQ